MLPRREPELRRLPHEQGVGGWEHFAAEVVVDGEDHAHHPARRSLERRFVGEMLPAADALLRVAVDAVQAQRRGEHAHGVHELVHRNALEDLKMLNTSSDICGLGAWPACPLANTVLSRPRIGTAPTMAPMFSPIVVGFDDSCALARDALALAQHPRRRRHRDRCGLRVPGRIALGAGDPARVRGVGGDDAEARLAVAAERLHGRADVRFVTRAARSAAAALHEVAEETGAQLVVVGSSHRGALRRILPGDHRGPGAVGRSVRGGGRAGGALRAAVGAHRERRRRLRRRRRGGGRSRRRVPSRGRAARGAADARRRGAGRAGVRLGGEWVDNRGDAVAAMRAELGVARAAPQAAAGEGERGGARGRPGTNGARARLGAGGRPRPRARAVTGPVGRLVLGSVAARVATAAACPLVPVPARGSEQPPR